MSALYTTTPAGVPDMTATEPEKPNTGPPSGTDLEMCALLCSPTLTEEEAARELWRQVTSPPRAHSTRPVYPGRRGTAGDGKP